MVSRFVLTLIALSAGSAAALAQPAVTPVPPPEAVAPSPAALPPPANVSERPAEQQASLPEDAGTRDLLAAIRDNPDSSRQIAALGPVPASRIEIRDAAALERESRRPDTVRTAMNDNPEGVREVRQSIIRNRSVDQHIAREQVPITNVVAADVANDGHVVVYAYPQGVTPPQ